jgi:hypothetical protein
MTKVHISDWSIATSDFCTVYSLLSHAHFLVASLMWIRLCLEDDLNMIYDCTCSILTSKEI